MDRNQQLFQKAKRLMPGGVNSPVRAFGAVGGHPFFVKKAKGATLWDEAGNRYIDYVLSWGPMLLGHAHPKVIQAVHRAVQKGTSFGVSTEAEIRLAELIRHFFPSIEKLRLVSSGTEAVMSAVRLARGVTGRDLMLKFEGCYHGHGDSFLVKAGSGSATFGQPNSKGVPRSLASLTIALPFNDINAVKNIFRKRGRQIACIVVEPVAGNMGCIPPKPDFLKTLRGLTQKYKSLLIFDEVMTGWRVSLGGAQRLYGVKPDLTCLGKVVGGGMPLAVYGGKRKWMDQVSPLGGVYQAGTLSGNPAAVACGIATLETLKKHTNHFRIAEKRAKELEKGLNQLIRRKKLLWTVNRVGTMWTLFLGSGPIENFQDVQKTDLKLFSKLFQFLLKKGVYITPSAFEANFTSSAHTSAHIQQTLRAIEEFVR